MKDKPVRLKIAVGPELAHQVKRISEACDRSQSWVAAQLLAIMVNENKRFLGWVLWRLAAESVHAVKGLADLVKPFAGKESKPLEESTEYLQAYVTQDLFEAISRQAQALGLSEAEAAARMLYCSIEVQGWAIGMINSQIGLAMQGLLNVTPAENEPGNLEENAALERRKAKDAKKAKATVTRTAARRASA